MINYYKQPRILFLMVLAIWLAAIVQWPFIGFLTITLYSLLGLVIVSVYVIGVLVRNSWESWAKESPADWKGI